MTSRWTATWGLRGRVARRFFGCALAVMLLARCDGDAEDWCCCCEGGVPWLVDWIEPEHERIEEEARRYASASETLRALAGEGVEVTVEATLGLPAERYSETTRGERIRIVEVRVVGAAATITAHVYVVERDGTWTAVAMRWERDGEWTTEGEVPRQPSDETAEVAAAYAEASPEIAARVGAIQRVEVERDAIGEPSIRTDRSRVGGPHEVVVVTVVGAAATIAVSVWVDAVGAPIAVGATLDDGTSIGAVPAVRPPEPRGRSSGRSYGGGGWD